MKFDIVSLKRKLSIKYPFFGSVLANVNYIEDEKIKTALTDGKTIYYNKTFLETINQEQQLFIFAHELCHIAFNHILRSEGKNHQIWNIATDAVINQMLKRDGLDLIEGVIDIPDAINYNAEQLYEKMLQKNPKESAQEKQTSEGRGSSNKEEQTSGKKSSSESKLESDNEYSWQDTHSLWEEAVKKHKEAKENRKQSEFERKQKELEKIGEKEFFQKNRIEKKQKLEDLKKAIMKQATAGIRTNGEERKLENIKTLKPLIDWRYVLRESIQYDVDWSYKNATIEDFVLTSHLEEQQSPETEILLDTSGSINEILLKNFLRECKHILQYSKIKVGCFDTEFYGFEEIRTETDIDKMKFLGGGGTDFDVAVNSFTRRVENKIIFTDGFSLMPQIPMNVIWIVFSGITIEPAGGKVITLSKEQLNRLLSYDQMDYQQYRKTRQKRFRDF